MLDSYSRKIAAKSLEPAADWLGTRSVSPMVLTIIGLGFGVSACVSIALGRWWLGLGLWGLNRIFDGLDGMAARNIGPTSFGGFADIIADFVVYSGFVVAVAYRLPETRFAAVVLLMTYYVSGAAFLAWSDLVARQRHSAATADGRSLDFPPGIAEGTETIIVYALICLFPTWALELMWVFAAMVGITAIQRIWWANKTLRS